LGGIVTRGNLFSGAIPIELANLQQLQFLDLAPNIFSGNIPREFGTLTNLSKCFACKATAL